MNRISTKQKRGKTGEWAKHPRPGGKRISNKRLRKEDIDAGRISAGEIARIKNKLTRIVVAVDPSGGQGENHDDVGIVVCGCDKEGRGYILEDAT